MSRVNIKWRQQPETNFREHLNTIKVEVISAPTWEELKSYIPEFANATWEDVPKNDYTDEEQENTVRELFRGRVLPTAFETIRITLRIEGLDLIDVTHLLRHRVFSFSAQCSADRDQRKDDCLVKPSIMANPLFYNEYMRIVESAKQLYATMVDSKQVSIFDARTILPRSMSNFYYVSGNIKNFIDFINTRKDEAIQPESDNVIAIRIYQELVKLYPILSEIIKFGTQDKWFVETAKRGGHNSMAYMPKRENDVFNYSPEDFIYHKKREDFPGSKVYLNIRKEVTK